jgi:hypothetical protein
MPDLPSRGKQPSERRMSASGPSVNRLNHSEEIEVWFSSFASFALFCSKPGPQARPPPVNDRRNINMNQERSVITPDSISTGEQRQSAHPRRNAALLALPGGHRDMTNDKSKGFAITIEISGPESDPPPSRTSPAELTE